MDKIDPQRVTGRDEQRHNHQNDDGGIQNAAQKQDQNIHQEQEHQRANVGPGQQCRDRLRNVLLNHHIGEDHRGADHEADGGCRSCALDKHLVQRSQLQCPVQPCCNNQRIERGYGGGLGWCGDAGIDTSQQDHWHQQGGRRLCCNARQFTKRHRLFLAEVTTMRYPGVHPHQDDAHHQARDDPGQKQAANRGVRDQRIEHHRDRGRNDRTDCCCRGGDGGGIAAGVAPALDHHVDDDLADASCIGHRRTGHAGKDEAGHDIDMTKTAAEPADKRHAEMQQPVGNRAGIHDISGHDEKRYRQKQKPVEQPLHHGFTGDGDVLASNT